MPQYLKLLIAKKAGRSISTSWYSAKLIHCVESGAGDPICTPVLDLARINTEDLSKLQLIDDTTDLQFYFADNDQTLRFSPSMQINFIRFLKNFRPWSEQYHCFHFAAELIFGDKAQINHEMVAFRSDAAEYTHGVGVGKCIHLYNKEKFGGHLAVSIGNGVYLGLSARGIAATSLEFLQTSMELPEAVVVYDPDKNIDSLSQSIAAIGPGVDPASVWYTALKLYKEISDTVADGSYSYQQIGSYLHEKFGAVDSLLQIKKTHLFLREYLKLSATKEEGISDDDDDDNNQSYEFILGDVQQKDWLREANIAFTLLIAGFVKPRQSSDSSSTDANNNSKKYATQSQSGKNTYGAHSSITSIENKILPMLARFVDKIILAIPQKICLVGGAAVQAVALDLLKEGFSAANIVVVSAPTWIEKIDPSWRSKIWGQSVRYLPPSMRLIAERLFPTFPEAENISFGMMQDIAVEQRRILHSLGVKIVSDVVDSITHKPSGVEYAVNNVTKTLLNTSNVHFINAARIPNFNNQIKAREFGDFYSRPNLNKKDEVIAVIGAGGTLDWAVRDRPQAKVINLTPKGDRTRPDLYSLLHASINMDEMTVDSLASGNLRISGKNLINGESFTIDVPSDNFYSSTGYTLNEKLIHADKSLISQIDTSPKPETIARFYPFWHGEPTLLTTDRRGTKIPDGNLNHCYHVILNATRQILGITDKFPLEDPYAMMFIEGWQNALEAKAKQAGIKIHPEFYSLLHVRIKYCFTDFLIKNRQIWRAIESLYAAGIQHASGSRLPIASGECGRAVSWQEFSSLLFEDVQVTEDQKLAPPADTALNNLTKSSLASLNEIGKASPEGGFHFNIQDSRPTCILLSGPGRSAFNESYVLALEKGLKKQGYNVKKIGDGVAQIYAEDLASLYESVEQSKGRPLLVIFSHGGMIAPQSDHHYLDLGNSLVKTEILFKKLAQNLNSRPIDILNFSCQGGASSSAVLTWLPENSRYVALSQKHFSSMMSDITPFIKAMTFDDFAEQARSVGSLLNRYLLAGVARRTDFTKFPNPSFTSSFFDAQLVHELKARLGNPFTDHETQKILYELRPPTINLARYQSIDFHKMKPTTEKVIMRMLANIANNAPYIHTDPNLYALALAICNSAGLAKDPTWQPPIKLEAHFAEPISVQTLSDVTTPNQQSGGNLSSAITMTTRESIQVRQDRESVSLETNANNSISANTKKVEKLQTVIPVSKSTPTPVPLPTTNTHSSVNENYLPKRDYSSFSSKEAALKWQNEIHQQLHRQALEISYELEKAPLSTKDRIKLDARLQGLIDHALEYQRHGGKEITHFVDEFYLDRKVYGDVYNENLELYRAHTKTVTEAFKDLVKGLIPAFVGTGTAFAVENIGNAFGVNRNITDLTSVFASTGATGIAAGLVGMSPYGRAAYMLMEAISRVTHVLEKHEVTLLLNKTAEWKRNSSLAALGFGQASCAVLDAPFHIVIAVAVGAWQWLTTNNPAELAQQSLTAKIFTEVFTAGANSLNNFLHGTQNALQGIGTFILGVDSPFENNRKTAINTSIEEAKKALQRTYQSSLNDGLFSELIAKNVTNHWIHKNCQNDVHILKRLGSHQSSQLLEIASEHLDLTTSLMAGGVNVYDQLNEKILKAFKASSASNNYARNHIAAKQALINIISKVNNFNMRESRNFRAKLDNVLNQHFGFNLQGDSIQQTAVHFLQGVRDMEQFAAHNPFYVNHAQHNKSPFEPRALPDPLKIFSQISIKQHEPMRHELMLLASQSLSSAPDAFTARMRYNQAVTHLGYAGPSVFFSSQQAFNSAANSYSYLSRSPSASAVFNINTAVSYYLSFLNARARGDSLAMRHYYQMAVDCYRSQNYFSSTLSFSNFLSATGLSSSYNSYHEGLSAVNALFGDSGSIGGVASQVGLIKGFVTSADELLYDNHLFILDQHSDNLFSQNELQQLLNELYHGIIEHDTLPFFSLDFNDNKVLYPVIHPAYANTLVGHVISQLDYYLKGYLNGGIYSESVLVDWQHNLAIDKDYLNKNLLDLKKLYQQSHIEVPYTSLREDLFLAGLESNSDVAESAEFSVKNSKNFNNSFRIIAKQGHIYKRDGIFKIDPQFDVEYTIEPSAQYKAYLEEYHDQHGDYPEEYKKLRVVYARFAEKIKLHMPELPLFRKYFTMLGVINFFCYYMNTLKEMGKKPIFRELRRSESRQYAVPSAYPSLPIRFFETGKVHLTLREILDELSVSEKNTLKDFLFEFWNQQGDASFPTPLETHLNDLLRSSILSKLSAYTAIRELDERLINKTWTLFYSTLVNQLSTDKFFPEVELLKFINSKGVTFPKEFLAELEQEDCSQVELLNKIKKHVKTCWPTLIREQINKGNTALESHLRLLFSKNAKISSFKVQNNSTEFFAICQTEIDLMEKHHDDELAKFDKILTEVQGNHATLIAHLGQAKYDELIKFVADTKKAKKACAELRKNIIDWKTTIENVSDSSKNQGEIERYCIELLKKKREAIFNAIDLKHAILNNQPITQSAISADFSQTSHRVVGGCGMRLSSMQIEDIPLSDEVIEQCRIQSQSSITTQLISLPSESGSYPILILPIQFETLEHDIEEVVSLKLPPIHQAVIDENIADIEKLYQEDPSIINLPYSQNGYTPLMIAVENGCQQSVAILLKLNANLNIRLPSGIFSLYLAILNGREDISLMLIKHSSIDLNQQLRNGNSALHLAIELKLMATVQALIEHGADVNLRRFSDDLAAIHVAVNCGQREIVTKILSKYPEQVNLTTTTMDTPLHLAASLGNLSLVDFLLQSGANPNAQNRLHRTALAHAIYYSHNNVARALINVTELKVYKNSQGENYATMAHNHGLKDIKAILEKSGLNAVVTYKKTTPPKITSVNIDREVRVDSTVNQKDPNEVAKIYALYGKTAQSVSRLIRVSNFRGVHRLLKHLPLNYLVFTNLQGFKQPFIHHLLSFSGINLEKLLMPYHDRINITVLDERGNPLWMNLSDEPEEVKNILKLLNSLFGIKQVETMLGQKNDRGDDYFMNLAKVKDSDLLSYICENYQSSLNTSLIKAIIIADNINLLKLLADKIPTFNFEFENKMTPLGLAAALKLNRMVQYLLSQGADADYQNSNHEVPLSFADGECGLLLINAMSNLNPVNNKGFTPLMTLIAKNSQLVREMINRGADIHNINQHGMTSLHAVALMEIDEPVEMVEYLLMLGADINALGGMTRGESYTPLHLAASNNKPRLFEILLNKGAKASILDSSGRTAVALAAEQNSVLFNQILVKLWHFHSESQQIKLIIHAAMGNNVLLLKEFYFRGIKIDGVDDNGRNALHVASVAGSVAATQFLMDVGFDADALDNEGHSALHYAVIFERHSIVETLTEYNISIDQLCANGKTPLYISAEKGYFAISLRLINRSANAAFLCVGTGLTVAQTALLNGHYKLAESLFILGDRSITSSVISKLNLLLRNKFVSFQGELDKFDRMAASYSEDDFHGLASIMGHKEMQAYLKHRDKINLHDLKVQAELTSIPTLAVRAEIILAKILSSLTDQMQDYALPKQTATQFISFLSKLPGDAILQFYSGFEGIESTKRVSFINSAVKFVESLNLDSAAMKVVINNLLSLYPWSILDFDKIEKIVSLVDKKRSVKVINLFNDYLTPLYDPATICAADISFALDKFAEFVKTANWNKSAEKLIWTKPFILGSPVMCIRSNLALPIQAEHLAPFTIRFDSVSDDLIERFSQITDVQQYPLPREECKILVGLYFGAFKETVTRISNFTRSELIAYAYTVSQQLEQDPSREHQAMLLAIIAVSAKHTCNIFPYDTQICALLAMVNPVFKKGSIAQIKTGEGKSLITAMFALFFALQSRYVDVHSSSEELACRDEQTYRKLFNFLEVTSSSISNDAIANGFSGRIVYGASVSFEFTLLRELRDESLIRISDNLHRPYDLAIADEEDNLCLDNAIHPAIISAPSLRDHSYLYEPIYRLLITYPDLSIDELQKKLCTQFPEKADSISLTLLKRLIAAKDRAGELVKNQDYIVQNDEIIPVDAENTGALNRGQVWSDGMHQFVEVKNNISPKSDTVYAGMVTHVSFLQQYKNLYGLSGTLGDSAERAETKAIYGTETFDIPSHKQNQMLRETAFSFKTHQDYLEEIYKEAVEYGQKAGRPVLMLFKTIRHTQEIAEFFTRKNIHFQICNEVQEDDKSDLIRRAGHKGMITIATCNMARGTDIRLSSLAVASGGLRIVLGFYPVNSRVENQIFGRAGRQGQPGSGRMIISPQDEYYQEIVRLRDMQSLLLGRKIKLSEARTLKTENLSKRRIEKAKQQQNLFQLVKDFSEHRKAITLSLAKMQNDTLCDYVLNYQPNDQVRAQDIIMHPQFVSVYNLLCTDKIILAVQQAKQLYIMWLNYQWGILLGELQKSNNIDEIKTKYQTFLIENLIDHSINHTLGFQGFMTQLVDWSRCYQGKNCITRDPALSPPTTDRHIRQRAKLHYKAGFILYENNELIPALAQFNACIEKDEEFVFAWYMRAHCYARLHHFQDAMSNLDHAVLIDHGCTAPCDFRNEDVITIDYANLTLLEAYKKFAKVYPNYIKAKCYLAVMLLKVYRNTNEVALFDEAKNLFQSAIDLDPNYGWSYYYKAIGFFNIGKMDEAIEAFNQALEFMPNYAPILALRGISYLMSPTKASLGLCLADLAVASREAHSAEVYLHVFLGKMYSKIPNQLQNAIVEFKKALQIDPDHETAKYFLNKNISLDLNDRSVDLINVGESRQAISLLDQAIHLTPTVAKLYFQRAYARLQLGEIDQALVDANKSIDLQSHENADYYFVHAMLLYLDGQFDEALIQCRKGFEIDPNNCEGGLAIKRRLEKHFVMEQACLIFSQGMIEEAKKLLKDTFLSDVINIPDKYKSKLLNEDMTLFSCVLFANSKSDDLFCNTIAANLVVDAEYHILHALLLYKCKKFNEAARICEKALALAPNNVMGLYFNIFINESIRSNRFNSLTKFQKTIKIRLHDLYPILNVEISADKIIALEPSNAAHYLGLANLFKRQYRNDKALQLIEKLLEFDPANQEAVAIKVKLLDEAAKVKQGSNTNVSQLRGNTNQFFNRQNSLAKNQLDANLSSSDRSLQNVSKNNVYS